MCILCLVWLKAFPCLLNNNKCGIFFSNTQENCVFVVLSRIQRGTSASIQKRHHTHKHTMTHVTHPRTHNTHGSGQEATRPHNQSNQMTKLHQDLPEQPRRITTTSSTRNQHPKGVDVVGIGNKCQARLSPDGSWHHGIWGGGEAAEAPRPDRLNSPPWRN
jgi:hypothetical protein